MTIRKSIISAITLSSVSLFAVPVFAINSPVIDEIDVLSPTEEQQLEQRIYEIERSTTAEIAIILPKNLNGLDIREYGREVTDKLQIGKSDTVNGMAIILAIPERKSAIETGYGTEGIITDILAKAMLEQIKPQLRAEDYAGALNSVLNNSQALLEGDDSITSELKGGMTTRHGIDRSWAAADGLVFPLAIIWLLCIWKNKEKQPYRYFIFGILMLLSIYFFGFFITLVQNMYGAAAGLMFSGGGRGRYYGGSGGFGGGGFSGGSSFGGFGGGGFGGGGASNSW